MDVVGNRTLRDLLDERAERYPDRVCFVHEDRDGRVAEVTYAGFRARVERVAAGLSALGIAKGDRVLVHLSNCAELLESWFALATLGAVMVPSNTANTTHEVTYLLEFSGAVAAITEPQHVATVQSSASGTTAESRLILARTSTPHPGTVLFDDVAAAPGPAPRPRVDGEDVLQMLFTSGTTARPKGVLLTHANALHAGERESRGLYLDETDRCMTALPLFHVNAQVITVLSAMTVGATAVILEEFRATKYWDQLRHHGATQTSLVATQLRTLLAQPPRDSDRDHRIRRLFYALNVSDQEREDFESRFGVELINAYGLSEAMTLVTLCPVFGPKKWPSIGKPLLGRTVRLVDHEGNDVEVGEVGEIVVEGVPGRTLMKGYFNNPEATQHALRDGWLWTGDNAYADADGYLYWFDRRADMVKRAGENVSTAEVEFVLASHPEVAEVAVVGVPDPWRDEAVAAVVVRVAGSDLTADQLREHCQDRLAGFKIPTLIDFRDELPRTSIGKLSKGIIRTELADRQLRG